jgi:hypothetical protein
VSDTLKVSDTSPDCGALWRQFETLAHPTTRLTEAGYPGRTGRTLGSTGTYSAGVSAPCQATQRRPQFAQNAASVVARSMSLMSLRSAGMSGLATMSHSPDCGSSPFQRTVAPQVQRDFATPSILAHPNLNGLGVQGVLRKAIASELSGVPKSHQMSDKIIRLDGEFAGLSECARPLDQRLSARRFGGEIALSGLHTVICPAAVMFPAAPRVSPRGLPTASAGPLAPPRTTWLRPQVGSPTPTLAVPR